MNKLQLNTVYFGFLLQQQYDVPSYDGTLYVFQHQKTHARLVYFARQDTNKTFAITFKTLPSDDTGVFHILEHSVLNGSKKYPVKEPFVELLKGSLQTFLNAFTYPDKTMYPISSRNAKDFRHLMDVYLDAVFHPAIMHNPNIFLQEGWRYEKNGDTFTYNGVVLNEMKGAFSSADEILMKNIARMIFKDNCYGFVSGGDPKAIVDLTYEQFLKTHQTFYHPSNSRIFLDGDLDILDTLQFIDEEYLQHYDALDVHFDIVDQVPLKATTKEVTYDLVQDDLQQRTIICQGKIVSRFDQPLLTFAYLILAEYLVGNNDALLTKPIVASGLCEDVEFDVLNGVQQPWAILTLRNTEKQHWQTLQQIIKETVENAIEQGLNHRDLLAIISQMEFKFNEGSENVGISSAQRIMETWLYSDEVVQPFLRNELFAQLKQKVNEGFFEQCMADFFLDQDHLQTLMAIPSKTHQEQIQMEEQAKLASRTKLLDLKAFQKQADQFQQWQSQQDSKEALATIPKLQKEDLDDRPQDYPFTLKEYRNIPWIYQESLNHIVYTTLYFEISDIDQNDLMPLSLYIGCLGQLPTKHYDLQELQTCLKESMGNLSMTLDCYTHKQDVAQCRPVLAVSFSALKENVHQAIKYIQDILFHTRFEKELVFPLLKQENESFRQGLNGNGHVIGLRYLQSQYTSEGIFKENVDGYTSALYESHFEKHFEEMFEPWLKQVEQMMKRIWNQNRLTISSTADDLRYLDPLLSMLHHDSYVKHKATYTTNPKENIGICIGGGVSYATCLNQLNGLPYDPTYAIVGHLVTYEFLWNEVRVKLGAYGTGCLVSPMGTLGAYSYRDNQPQKVLQVYRKIANFIQNFHGDDLTSYMIGVLANANPLLSPKGRVKITDSLYFKESTYEDRIKVYQKMKEFSLEDVHQAQSVFEQMFAQMTSCIAGPKALLQTIDDIRLLEQL